MHKLDESMKNVFTDNDTADDMLMDTLALETKSLADDSSLPSPSYSLGYGKFY